MKGFFGIWGLKVPREFGGAEVDAHTYIDVIEELSYADGSTGWVVMAAGFAGIVNAPVVSLTPGMGETILVQTFVVVVIGGVGSFPGAVLGGLIAGEIISITSMINPAYSYIMLFAAMTLVLVLRPRGLFGKKGRE